LKLAQVGVDVAVGGADGVGRYLVAVGRTLGDGPLLRDAIRYGHLEDVTSAVFDSHLAAAGVDASVRATHGFGGLPANLLTVAGRLAVLLRRPHHAFPASEELHFARGRVDVAVGTANGTVAGGVSAVDRARLLQRRGIQAGPHVCHFDPSSAGFDFENARVEVGPAVRSARQIAILIAPVLAERSSRSPALAVIHDGNSFVAVAPLEVAFVDVDDTVGSAHGFVVFGAQTRARVGVSLPHRSRPGNNGRQQQRR